MSELFVRADSKADDPTKSPVLGFLKKFGFGHATTVESSGPHEVVNWKQLRARSVNADEVRGNIAVALAESLQRENDLP